VKIDIGFAGAGSQLWYIEPWANSHALTLPWRVIHFANVVPRFMLDPLGTFDTSISKVFLGGVMLILF
jgi:hypothetical protein